jgi:hypothetical protein
METNSQSTTSEQGNSLQPQTSLDETVERSAASAQNLATKILQGLSSKRSDERWEDYEERVIQMFRQKGLFRNSESSNPSPDNPSLETTSEPYKRAPKGWKPDPSRHGRKFGPAAPTPSQTLSSKTESVDTTPATE